MNIKDIVILIGISSCFSVWTTDLNAAQCEQVFSANLNSSLVESAPLHNQRFEIYPEGKFHPNYDLIIKNLQPGDSVVLPSGRYYVLHGRLGSGALTAVFDLGDGYVLRLPRTSRVDAMFMEDIPQKAMSGFFKMHTELKKSGVPVVEMDRARTESPYAIVVKKENIVMTGSQFVTGLRDGFSKTTKPKLIEKMKKSFLEFMDTTWAYIDISDVTPDQMVFNGEKWVLIDFFGFGSPSHMPLRNFAERKTAMHSRTYEDDGRVEFLGPLEKPARARISQIRANVLDSNNWYQRSEIRSTDEGELIDRVLPHPLPRGWSKSFSKFTIEWGRDLAGYYPKGPTSIRIEIVGHLKDQDNEAIYQVVVNSKHRAQLRVMIDARKSPRAILRIEAQIKKSGQAYLAGTDFILVYDDPLIETDLIPSRR